VDNNHIGQIEVTDNCCSKRGENRKLWSVHSRKTYWCWWCL